MLISLVKECFEVQLGVHIAQLLVWCKNHAYESKCALLDQVFFEENVEISSYSLHQLFFSGLGYLQHYLALTFLRIFIVQDKVKQVSKVIFKFRS